jgi:hypothetical protein
VPVALLFVFVGCKLDSISKTAWTEPQKDNTVLVVYKADIAGLVKSFTAEVTVLNENGAVLGVGSNMAGEGATPIDPDGGKLAIDLSVGMYDTNPIQGTIVCQGTVTPWVWVHPDLPKPTLELPLGGFPFPGFELIRVSGSGPQTTEYKFVQTTTLG